MDIMTQLRKLFGDIAQNIEYDKSSNIYVVYGMKYGLRFDYKIDVNNFRYILKLRHSDDFVFKDIEALGYMSMFLYKDLFERTKELQNILNRLKRM